MPFRVIPSGYEHAVPPGKTDAPIRPTVGNAHQWVCTAVFNVSQHAVDAAAAVWAAGGPPVGIELDHENLMTVQGPACIKCSQPLTPATHASPCPVQVVPILGYAN